MIEPETQAPQERCSTKSKRSLHWRQWLDLLGHLLMVLLSLGLLLLASWVLYINIKSFISHGDSQIQQVADPVSEQRPQALPSAANRTCNGDELVCLQVTTMLPNATLQDLANIPVPPGSASHYLVRVSVTPIDE